MSNPTVARCKHCGCRVYGDTLECQTIGWCALLAARKPDATEDEQLIADAVAAFSALDDARKARSVAVDLVEVAS